MRVLSVVGTRPNFMKMAPVISCLKLRGIDHALVHTGQHYDMAMSQVFLDDLEVAEPDYMLAVGSGSQAEQTALIMTRMEPVLLEQAPDVMVVPGDVTSTLAATLVAAKLSIPVAHVEAGLRSFDRTMPEEINRVVTDQLSSMLFTHSPEARGNLEREGCDPQAIFEVGNTMIDTLMQMLPRIEQAGSAASLGLDGEPYLVVTLHRPALVDGPLLEIALARLAEVAKEVPVVFPVHPRTRARIDALSLPGSSRILLVEPLSYIDFLSLVRTSSGVLTDSGGIQEETTYLGVPCCTLRANTERPVTVNMGTNVLLGLDPERIADVPRLLAEIRARKARIPALWDGNAAERIVNVLLR